MNWIVPQHFIQMCLLLGFVIGLSLYGITTQERSAQHPDSNDLADVYGSGVVDEFWCCKPR